MSRHPSRPGAARIPAQCRLPLGVDGAQIAQQFTVAVQIEAPLQQIGHHTAAFGQGVQCVSSFSLAARPALIVMFIRA